MSLKFLPILGLAAAPLIIVSVVAAYITTEVLATRHLPAPRQSGQEALGPAETAPV